MIRLATLLPVVLGSATMIVAYTNFNAAALPREVEAGIAILAGWIAAFAATRAVRMISREESIVEKMLEDAGVSANHSSLRAAQLVHKGRSHVASMAAALATRSATLQSAFEDFANALEPLFENMLASPETAKRADDLVRRILPRIASAVQDYCHFAEYGDGIVDLSETRARLISAFEDAGAAAGRAHRDVLGMSEIDVTASLEVLETTLSHSR